MIHILIKTSYVIELDPTVDFEQPRALYTKVLDDVGRDHLVNNVVEHVRGVKSPVIKSRIRELCFRNVSFAYLTVFLNSFLLGFHPRRAFGPHCRWPWSPRGG